MCLSKETTEHVYEAVLNDQPVAPLYVSETIVDQSEFNVNPYVIGLKNNVDGYLQHEPLAEMKQCDMTWSILSTVLSELYH